MESLVLGEFLQLFDLKPLFSLEFVARKIKVLIKQFSGERSKTERSKQISKVFQTRL